MEKLYNLLLSYELLGAAALIYLTIFFLKRISPDFWKLDIPNKILSDVLPEVLGVAFFVLLHVTKLQDYNWWEMALGGLAAGYLAPKAYAVFAVVKKIWSNFTPKTPELFPEDIPGPPPPPAPTDQPPI